MTPAKAIAAPSIPNWLQTLPAGLLGEMAVPIAPGSPLCRSRARNDLCDGLEIAMKGGQVGKADYFASVLRGAA